MNFIAARFSQNMSMISQQRPVRGSRTRNRLCVKAQRSTNEHAVYFAHFPSILIICFPMPHHDICAKEVFCTKNNWRFIRIKLTKLIITKLPNDSFYEFLDLFISHFFRTYHRIKPYTTEHLVDLDDFWLENFSLSTPKGFHLEWIYSLWLAHDKKKKCWTQINWHYCQFKPLRIIALHGKSCPFQ